ncbi:hypothetical protein UT300018_33210 [Clostridium faecium]
MTKYNFLYGIYKEEYIMLFAIDSDISFISTIEARKVIVIVLDKWLSRKQSSI